MTVLPDSPRTPRVETIFPRVIDNTMYSDWRSCPHRFFRRHLQGLARGRVNVHLHFGGCFAYALEVARRNFCSGADPSDCTKDACEAFIDRWGTFEIPDGGTSQSERNKSLAAGLLAIQDYFREWPLDDPDAPGGLSIHSHNGDPCIEFSGALPIPGSHHPVTSEPIIYCGRFDMIGHEGNRCIGLDDKTTSSLGEHWRQQWRLRSQFTGYVWLAREYGVNLDGFRVRGTAILKGGAKFDYVDTPRAPWLVDRWLAQLQHDTDIMCAQFGMFTAYELSGNTSPLPHPFGQNFDHACSDFNGCAFLDLCSSEHADAWLSEYTIDRWNPLERQGA